MATDVETKIEGTLYAELLGNLETKIRTSQLQAASAVNRELILLYWDIGHTISTHQRARGWGSRIVQVLANDLKASIPDVSGFSLRNLQYMLKFAKTCTRESVEQLFVRLPWRHNILLFSSFEDGELRKWYARKTIENGWSRNILALWIESKLHLREGKAITNFDATLPDPLSDLASQTLKDPYCFDFLTLHQKYNEKEVEQGLIDHIQNFLTELGAGFAFLGRQYRLVVEDQEYLVDLLFYHTKLQCYCVIELKNEVFKPEHAGKMNFYLSAVDDLLRQPTDNPSIGMILCKIKNRFSVEYALRDINKPIGVSGYEVQILSSLPEDLKGSLPTLEEIESELDRQLCNARCAIASD